MMTPKRHFEINWPLQKWCSIFDSSPLIQNSKFNNFLWVCWFLCKNLSNLVPPRLKTPQPVLPYCIMAPQWVQSNSQAASWFLNFMKEANFYCKIWRLGKCFTLAGVIFFSVQLNAQNICEKCAHMINVVSYQLGR